jgi:uncharacterized membrane protein
MNPNQSQIDELKGFLARWDKDPLRDSVLRDVLKMIKILETGVQNYDFWKDYPKEFEPDTKNWRICQCDEGNIGNNTLFRKHRHRIPRTLEQAIKELNE